MISENLWKNFSLKFHNKRLYFDEDNNIFKTRLIYVIDIVGFDKDNLPIFKRNSIFDVIKDYQMRKFNEMFRTYWLFRI